MTYMGFMFAVLLTAPCPASAFLEAGYKRGKGAPDLMLTQLRARVDAQDTYFVINTGMGWQEAENECVSQGGHLASITSQAENGVVSALCATSVCVGEGCQQWQASPFCWIGGKKLADDLQSGAFNWTDGTTETTYTNKDHNHQFVGVPDQPYLAMRRGTGTWQFEYVGLTYTAVCERQVVAQAVGDPHMTNILGQRFDLARPGVHLLVQVPQRAGPRGALLIVSAEVRLMGPSCSDMYIQKLNITGRWTRRRGTTRYMARSGHIPKGWHHFGKVDLKVVRGTTNAGIKYLNFLTRRLANTGLAVGGLLGEGDHSLASARLPGCIKTLAL